MNALHEPHPCSVARLAPARAMFNTVRVVAAFAALVFAAAAVLVSFSATAQTLSPAGAAAAPDTIDRIKRSIVAVGTVQRTRSPQFQFMGTGFAVGDGSYIATNAHVIPNTLNINERETLAVLLPIPGEVAQWRELQRVASDPGRDLAVLRMGGQPLTPLTLRRGGRVRDGETYLFTGYPIGSILGPFPVTHRGMIASITPIAIPQGRAGDLDPQTIRRLSVGPIPIFQLDGTAYPGNSGSPLYDPETGEVVGVINMVFVRGSRESALSQPSGITYAIPVDHLARMVAEIK